MSTPSSSCLVVLAGGQSSRMGKDKAIVSLGRQRLIDRMIERFEAKTDAIVLSAGQDFGTGLQVIADDPAMPAGPVGAIFSIAMQLNETNPGLVGFVTAPVDAPFAPTDLVQRLSESESCAVAESGRRLHPTFAYWRCGAVNDIRSRYDGAADAPSLHWLADQCDARIVTWPDQQAFFNINTSHDLAAAMVHLQENRNQQPND